MIFLYQDDSKSIELVKSKIIWSAYRTVITFPKRSTEKLLEEYLKEHYKTLLLPTCLKLIQSAKISYNSTNTFIITFPTKELNELARIITYGTGKILGSPILKVAFKNALNKMKG